MEHGSRCDGLLCHPTMREHYGRFYGQAGLASYHFMFSGRDTTLKVGGQGGWGINEDTFWNQEVILLNESCDVLISECFIVVPY